MERGDLPLLELLVVLATLGLLIGLVAPAVMRQFGTAKEKIAQQSVERLATVLDVYKLDIGSYPTTDQGLQALLTQPQKRQPLGRPLSERRQTPPRTLGDIFLSIAVPASGQGMSTICIPLGLQARRRDRKDPSAIASK